MAGPEKTFQDRILPKLKALPHSYWVKVMKAEGGTPDLLGCVRGRFIGLELKSSKSHKPTPLQRHQLEKIGKARGVTAVVYPENWDEVFKLLKDYAEGETDGL